MHFQGTSEAYNYEGTRGVLFSGVSLYVFVYNSRKQYYIFRFFLAKLQALGLLISMLAIHAEDPGLIHIIGCTCTSVSSSQRP